MEEVDIFDEDEALAEMLKGGVLFSNCREYLWNGKNEGSTIVLFVNCNDVFAWACADAEPLLSTEIEELYKLWKSDNMWGPTQWVCKKRGEKPQIPIETDMKKMGSWPEWMSHLKANAYWEMLANEKKIPITGSKVEEGPERKE